jgi:hypothetical protein
MFGFDFTTSTSWWFVIVVLAIASVVAWWYYRRTIPPISLKQRIILTALRGIALFLLGYLISKPLLTFIVHKQEKPAIVVLVDNSKSMTLADAKGKREDAVRAFLKSSKWNDLASKATIQPFIFDAKVNKSELAQVDSIRFDGDATKIANAIQYVTKHRSDIPYFGVVLISDGNFTDGISPLYDVLQLGVPVFTVGVGDTTVQKDIQIKRIVTNDICYVGNRVPVTVVIQNSGCKGNQVDVSLRSDSGIIAMQKVALENENGEYEVQFSYVPMKEGMQKYDVVVSPVEGEITYRNNQSSFFSKALKSKFQILIVTGAPSADVAFFRRTVERDSSMTISFLLQRPDGNFSRELTQQEIEKADCIVLIGYPTSASSLEQIEKIRGQIKQNSKPIFVLLSRTISYERLSSFAQQLPAEIQSINAAEIEALPSVQQDQRLNPIVKLGRDIDVLSAWGELPPIYTQPMNISLKEGTRTIVNSVRKTTTFQPLILTRTVGNAKSCMALGYGLWRWKMMAESDKPAGSVYDNFIHNTIQWLVTKEDNERIRIEPAKRIFSSNDDIVFSAQLYDENYQGIDNAEISVSVTKENETYECVLASLGNGYYIGSLERLPAGSYHFVARASAQKIPIGSKQGMFTVGEAQEEFLETTMNQQLLQQLAVRSGGDFVHISEAEKLFSKLNSLSPRESVVHTHTVEIDLRSSYWMLALLICIFSAEWFLRKRYGLL